jgi:tetratricopeptide (TPR) repeat protein
MIQVTCQECDQSISMNESVKIMDQYYCIDCAKGIYESREDLTEEDFEPQIDPTICVQCQKDNDATPWDKIVELPACPDCISFVRNRPFPNWVKVFFLAILAIVIFSLFWNYRFIQAYIDLREFRAATSKADAEIAAAHLQSAAQHVPESEDLKVLATFYQGIACLQKDQSAQALKHFQSCQGKLPNDMKLEQWIRQAKIGVAFDNRDYDTFLRLAYESYQSNPADARSAARVASAYACKYVETGSESFKQKSLEHLQKARDMSPPNDPDFLEYEQRILYRLHAREVITRKQFYVKFPNGWKPPEKE